MTRIPELRSEIRRKNEEISTIAHRIEDRIETIADWKSMVYRHPFASMAVCVGVGVLASGALAPILRFATQQALSLGRSAIISAAVSTITARAAVENEMEHGVEDIAG